MFVSDKPSWYTVWVMTQWWLILTTSSGLQIIVEGQQTTSHSLAWTQPQLQLSWTVCLKLGCSQSKSEMQLSICHTSLNTATTPPQSDNMFRARPFSIQNWNATQAFVSLGPFLAQILNEVTILIMGHFWPTIHMLLPWLALQCLNSTTYAHFISLLSGKLVNFNTFNTFSPLYSYYELYTSIYHEDMYHQYSEKAESLSQMAEAKNRFSLQMLRGCSFYYHF